ncbi:hypothetical protein FN846DRAFT_891550 [Sphaerosporella brunnea]|uniref:Myb-like domain-containing protein n=1 Tax=Sphaerosporella brunnea TaxID=1250544 RepID=A0A5J5ET40_9PEZI|nr:hypothetical protein FN846DRAFT_891550 [Sphaerosporella brunnea]
MQSTFRSLNGSDFEPDGLLHGKPEVGLSTPWIGRGSYQATSRQTTMIGTPPPESPASAQKQKRTKSTQAEWQPHEDALIASLRTQQKPLSFPKITKALNELPPPAPGGRTRNAVSRRWRVHLKPLTPDEKDILWQAIQETYMMPDMWKFVALRYHELREQYRRMGLRNMTRGGMVVWGKQLMAEGYQRRELPAWALFKYDERDDEEVFLPPPPYVKKERDEQGLENLVRRPDAYRESFGCCCCHCSGHGYCDLNGYRTSNAGADGFGGGLYAPQHWPAKRRRHSVL